MNIFPICAFKDNYIWSWVDDVKHQLWVVDPGDPEPVRATLEKRSLELGGILLTHHHYDHSGGIPTLLKTCPDIQVIGSAASPISLLTQRVNDSDALSCGGVNLKVLAIPGHTLDHVAYFNEEVLFCGDTLFSAGCGRVFEGTMNQMYDSLQKLARLGPHTRMYCGHEYTEANLHFAMAVEPANLAIQEKLLQVQALREGDKPTLPVTLEEESRYNPFFRCAEPPVIHAAERYAKSSLGSPVQLFEVLRNWKNHFTF